MSEIRTALTRNIDEALKIDPAIFGENNELNSNGQVQITENLHEEGMDPNYGRMSGSENMAADNSGENKRKKIGNFQKVLNRIGVNKRNKSRDNDLTEDDRIGDLSQNAIKETTSANKMFGKAGYRSSFSRMWNSLFTNREQPMTLDESDPMKARSSKTLGRIFGARRSSTAAGIPMDIDENDQQRRMKSNSLGRRFAQGFSFNRNRSVTAGGGGTSSSSSAASMSPSKLKNNSPISVGHDQSVTAKTEISQPITIGNTY